MDYEQLRKNIEHDLIAQLKEKNISGAHYKDLVDDYLRLWDLKNKFMDDIEEIGIKVSGMHGPKSNPSIADLHKTGDRMIKTLEALGLKLSNQEPKEQPKKRGSLL